MIKETQEYSSYSIKGEGDQLTGTDIQDNQGDSITGVYHYVHTVSKENGV